MANREVEKQIKQVKRLTTKDHSLSGGFNRTELWCMLKEPALKNQNEELLYSMCYRVVRK